MNEIQKSLYEAMDLFVQDETKSNRNTLIIKAEVIDIEDNGLGIYSLKYQGQSFNAFAANPEISYPINSLVYVIIPNGDFSSNKVILSLANKDSYNLNTQQEVIYKYSSNLLSLPIDFTLDFKSDKNDYFLKVGADFEQVVAKRKEQNNTKYLLSAEILTNLTYIEQHGIGDYSFSITLPFEDGTTEEYKFSMSEFEGNPYGFNIWAKQEKTITINKKLLVDGDIKITKFLNNFETTNPDIIIKAISIAAIDIQTITDNGGVSLKINATEGRYFKDGLFSKEKMLTPTLFVSNKETKIQKYPCYWFQEDASVTPESNFYLSYGGTGWKCLNQRDAEAAVFSNDLYSLPIYPSFGTQNYKCVILYGKNSQVIDSIISIVNLDEDLSLTLNTSNGMTSYIKSSGNFTLTAKINRGIIINKERVYKLKDLEQVTLKWNRFDKYNNYLDSFEGWDTVEVDDNYYIFYKNYSILNINELNTFQCSLYYEDNIVSSDRIIIDNLSQAENCQLSIKNIDKVYQYDADGDSPFTAKYDGLIEAMEKENLPISFKLYNELGKELLDAEYETCDVTWQVPKNSLLKIQYTNPVSEDDDYYYYNSLKLYYTLVPKYKYNTNNTISLTVLVGDKEFKTSKTISFTKTGDNGSNGSSYNAVITFNNYEYNTLIDGVAQKCIIGLKKQQDNTYIPCMFKDTNMTLCTYVIENNVQSYINNLFNVRVYGNGGSLLPTSDYSVEYSFLNSNNEAISTLLSLQLKDKTKAALQLPQVYIEKQPQYSILKAAITITANNSVLYSYYPISYVYPLNTNIPVLYDSYWGVIYSSDGSKPKYNNTNFKFNTNVALSKIDSDFRSEAVNEEKNEDEDSIKFSNEWKLTPPKTLNTINNVRYCEATDKDGNRIIFPLLLLYNRYELENLNAWDGQSIVIDPTNSKSGYILAPQFGAGRKENDNTFTGVVLGQKYLSADNSAVGIYGFKNGQETILIDAESGEAHFGASDKGQIIIKPNSNSTIGGWQIGTNTLQSADGSIILDAKEGEIRTKGGNFKLSDAKVSAEIDISGVSGWEVYEDTETGLKGLKAASTYLLEDGSIHSPNFSLFGDGTIEIKNTNLGKLTITSEGNIQIGTEKLSTTSINGSKVLCLIN